jgi:hypothetical protein
LAFVKVYFDKVTASKFSINFMAFDKMIFDVVIFDEVSNPQTCFEKNRKEEAAADSNQTFFQ